MSFINWSFFDKRHDLKVKALILVISPFKSTFEGQAAGNGITGLIFHQLTVCDRSSFYIS